MGDVGIRGYTVRVERFGDGVRLRIGKRILFGRRWRTYDLTREQAMAACAGLRSGGGTLQFGDQAASVARAGALTSLRLGDKLIDLTPTEVQDIIALAESELAET